jgi:hypothetical protein
MGTLHNAGQAIVYHSRRGVLSAVISRHGCSAYLIPLLAVVRSSVGHAVNWLNLRYFACEPRIPESSTEI